MHQIRRALIARGRRCALLTSVAMGAVGAGALATAASAADVPAQAVAPSNTLGEIVVTAQKRSELLGDVPATISVINAAELAQRGIADTQALQFATPGFLTGNSAGWTNFYMRGLGNAFASPAAQSPVAIYVDGVYQADVSSAIFGLEGVDHVEVLKGPQGTLYGRNAVGGAINVITRAPKEGQELRAKAEFGNYNEKDFSVYLNAGSERIQGNFLLDRKTQDGWYKNVAPGGPDWNSTNDLTLRGKLRLLPSDNVELTLAGDYAVLKDPGPGLNSAPIDPAHGILPSGVAIGRFLQSQGVPLPPVVWPQEPWRTSATGDQSSRATNQGVSLTARIMTPVMDIVSITADRDFRSKHGLDQDGINLPIFGFRTNDFHRQFSQELQLISVSERRFTWIAGLYYLHDNAGLSPIAFDEAATFLGGAFGGPFITLNSKLKTDSYAIFGEGTYKLTDELSVVLGGRYSTDRLQHYVADLDVNIRGFSVVHLNSPGSSAKFDAFTPRITLKYNRPEGLYYATASKGYSSGLYDLDIIAPSAAQDRPIQPTKVKAYEVGAKWDLLDRRLRANLALFHYDVKSLQIQGLQGGGLTTFENADARIDGADFDAQWRITPALTVRVAAERLNARYSSYPEASAWAPNLNQPLSCDGTAVTFDASCLAKINLTGETLMRSPKFTSTVGFDYTLPVPDRVGRLVVSSDWYHSDYYRTTVNATIVSPAYDLVNATLRYTSPDERWTAALWGKNLNNAKYLVTGGETNLARPIMYGPPRMYGVTLSYRYSR